MKSFAGGNFLKKIFPDFEPIFPEAIKKYSDFKTYIQTDEMFKRNYVNKKNIACQKCNFKYQFDFVISNIKSFFAKTERCLKKQKRKDGGDDPY